MSVNEVAWRTAPVDDFDFVSCLICPLTWRRVAPTDWTACLVGLDTQGKAKLAGCGRGVNSVAEGVAAVGQEMATWLSVMAALRLSRRPFFKAVVLASNGSGADASDAADERRAKVYELGLQGSRRLHRGLDRRTGCHFSLGKVLRKRYGGGYSQAIGAVAYSHAHLWIPSVEA